MRVDVAVEVSALIDEGGLNPKEDPIAEIPDPACRESKHGRQQPQVRRRATCGNLSDAKHEERNFDSAGLGGGDG